MRASRRLRAALTLLMGATALSACVPTAGLPPLPTERPAAIDTSGLPAPLASVLDDQAGILTTGVDRFEIWICSVPTTSTAPIYQSNGLRLALEASALASVLNDTVTDYFLTLSSGAYRLQFTAGGDVELGDVEGSDECFARALEASGDAPGVLAIATAEHAAGESGGFGAVGDPCRAPADWPCPAAETGRGVYLGASDFHPDWGSTPALDLLEHEIGHVLGWPHSGGRTDAYASDIDVMSDSAAPRRVDPAARHGQGTLAINRVAAGWIPLDDVAVVEAGSTTTVELTPSQSGEGTRLAVIPVSDTAFLTVEYLAATGLQSHLPESGITVTLVDSAASSCANAQTTRSCRVQESLVDAAPFDDLMGAVGEQWEGYGWRVTVTSLAGDLATVETVRMS